MTYHTEWGPELVAALAAPFPPEAHKSKRQGGQSITFVDVHRYKDRLNRTVGPHGWSASVRLEPVGGKLIASVALTVLGVTKENVGDEVEVPEVNERGNEKIIGSPATNSYAQAFKRAASDFGLGAYLYDEDEREAAKRGETPASNASRQRLAGLVETLDKAGLNGKAADIKKGALDLALNGGPQPRVDKAIAWAEGLIKSLETEAAS
jgi:hypothetical protein